MKKGLGKGLDALFSVFDEENEVNEVEVKQPEVVETKTNSEVRNDGVVEMDIKMIEPNRNQPRKIFDSQSLKELAESIKQHGVIQPIVVNSENNGRYMIIAGERRFRASIIAGLNSVPVIIKHYNERQVKEVALVENLQREDLNPIEAAKAIKQLMDEYNFTQETVADRIGKSRPAIANTLRLLTLSPQVIELVEKNRLSAGHARCLVTVPSKEMQNELALKACDNKMNVRDFEKYVKDSLNPKHYAKSRTKVIQSLELKELIVDMQRVFKTKVSVIGNDKKGRISIDYFSRDDLERVSSIVNFINENFNE